jgi:hypothetical protein
LLPNNPEYLTNPFLIICRKGLFFRSSKECFRHKSACKICCLIVKSTAWKFHGITISSDQSLNRLFLHLNFCNQELMKRILLFYILPCFNHTFIFVFRDEVKTKIFRVVHRYEYYIYKDWRNSDINNSLEEVIANTR